MTSKQIRIAAVALLSLALLLALLAWKVGSQPAAPKAAAPAAAIPHPVVVTTRAVEAGKPLPADALKVEMLPIEPAGAYTEVARVAGQVPLVSIGANVPVLESQLLAGLAAQIPEGERAVAIAVDEVIGVATACSRATMSTCSWSCGATIRRSAQATHACCCPGCACWPTAAALSTNRTRSSPSR